VVVTHHAPHPLSVHPRYAGSALNASFASDLSEMMELWQPELWVHGHVHDTFDYVVRNTRVVCNPRGYGTENPAFDPALVVEI
jgi:Icc-related predicted phosphoesterase